jgi:hypothetical protein
MSTPTQQVCAQCGSPADTGDAFCGHCGASISRPVMRAPGPYTGPLGNFVPLARKPGPSRAKIAVGVLIGLFALIIFGVVVSHAPNSPNSSPASSSAPAQAHTPEQQLASALVGTHAPTTGATVTSATIFIMCPDTDGYDNDAGSGCGHDSSAVPASQWQQSGTWTFANGEVFLADGTQEDVAISVDNNGNIIWAATP